MTDKTDALLALADAERKALEGILSNLANDAGDVDDEAPWIGDDEDAYWAYHTYHAIQKLKALAAQPAASVDVDDAWMVKARELYGRCALFPETTADGMTALLELRNHVEKILANPEQRHDALADGESASA